MWRRRTALALGLLLAFSVLSLWVPARWPASFLQCGIFLLGIAWAARAAVSPVRLRHHVLLIPLTGATCWGFLQLVAGTTVYRFETWVDSLYWVTLLVLFFLGFQALGDPKVRSSLLGALLYLGFGVAVLSVIQLFTSEGKVFWIFPSGYTEMVLGPFVYHNDYAAFVELLLPVALFKAVEERGRAVLHSAIAAVLFASVIASASRAGSALVTLEVVVVLALTVARGSLARRRSGIVMAKICALVLLFTAVVGWSVLWRRLQQPDPFVHRREILASALAMARERPWLGFGLGTFETAYPAFALFDIGVVVNHAHNEWAEWLSEGGVPFLGMMFWVAAWSVRPALRSIWGIGLLSVFVHACVDYPTQRLGLAVWIFLMLSALAAWDANQRKAVPRANP